jgi:acyl carrier protein
MDPDTRPDQEHPDQEGLSFEMFRHMIAEKLQVDETLVKQEASFVEDLRADSIQLVELMLHLEEEGMGIPLEEAWEVQTVGDAYRLCREHAISGR